MEVDSRKTLGGLEKGRPTPLVHCDYTAKSALEAFDLIAPSRYKSGRYIIVSAWRNIAETPIQDDHLAVCDGRTVATPDDFVLVDVVENRSKFEIYNLNPIRKDCHEWYYYPSMKKNEILVFTLYDSNWRTMPRYTFHTSFKDIDAPSDAPPRESIECRCLVIFPDFQPNTIYANEYEDLVDAAVHKILQSLNYSSAWPDEGQLWMCTALYAENGVKNVVKSIVHEAAKQGHYDLDKATDEQRNDVINRLVTLGAFERLAKEGFPRSSLVDAAVRVIMNTVNTPGLIPDKNLEDLKALLKTSQSFEKTARMIVDGVAQHYPGMDNEEQRADIVKALLADRKFEEKVMKIVDV